MFVPCLVPFPLATLIRLRHLVLPTCALPQYVATVQREGGCLEWPASRTVLYLLRRRQSRRGSDKWDALADLATPLRTARADKSAAIQDCPYGLTPRRLRRLRRMEEGLSPVPAAAYAGAGAAAQPCGNSAGSSIALSGWPVRCRCLRRPAVLILAPGPGRVATRADLQLICHSHRARIRKAGTSESRCTTQ